MTLRSAGHFLKTWIGVSRLVSCLGVLSCMVLLPQPAYAQSVTWQLTATASPDHAVVQQTVALVTRYELVLTLQGGAALPPIDLGKPALVPSCTLSGAPAQNCLVVDVTSALGSVAPGTYTGVLRAIGPGGPGVSSVGSPFALTVRAPAAPGAPGLTRSTTGS